MPVRRGLPRLVAAWRGRLRNHRSHWDGRDSDVHVRVRGTSLDREWGTIATRGDSIASLWWLAWVGVGWRGCCLREEYRRP